MSHFFGKNVPRFGRNAKEAAESKKATSGVAFLIPFSEFTLKRFFDPQAYIPQSKADGSSIMEKSHMSMPISIVTGMFSASTALALVISIMAGP